MKALRMKLPSDSLKNIFLVRPLFVLAVLVLLADLFYVNLIYEYPALSDDCLGNVCITGKIREKQYDTDGSVKSVTVGEYICYPDDIDESLLKTGSIVTISGTLSNIDAPMNKGEFNLRSYYATKRVFYIVYADKITVNSYADFSLRDAFKTLNSKLARLVGELCPLEGGTVNTLLLGDKSLLSEGRRKLYTRAGVAHFLVISGLHISAAGNFIYRAVRRIGIRGSKASLLSMVFLFAYGLLVGFTVSVVRALIMFAIRLFSDICSRAYDMLNSVSVALILAIIANPYTILGSGFIYSYLTVFSIAIYFTYVKSKDKSESDKETGPLGLSKGSLPVMGQFPALHKFKVMLKETLTFPTVIFLFVMPMSLYLSYSYSLASVFVNALLAPLSGPILMLSFLCFLFSLLNLKFFAGFFDFLLAILLRMLDSLCLLLGNVEAFEILGQPPVWKLCLYYLGLLCILTVFLKKLSPYLKILLIVSILSLFGNTPVYDSKISMLYVGQGECIVIRTGNKSAAIIDCGSTSKNNIAEYTVVPFLKAEGIYEISAIFATHSDTDHMGDIGSLIENCKSEGISVNELFLTDISEEYKDELYIETVEKAEALDVLICYVSSGMNITSGKTEFNVLSPSKEHLTGDSNTDSLVMLAEINGFQILLTGDATDTTESSFVGKLPANIDALKVAHHGSKSATSEKLLKAVNFDIGIISAGINNRYHHPSEEVTERLKTYGIDYFVTKDSGEIDVEIYGSGRYVMKVFK